MPEIQPLVVADHAARRFGRDAVATDALLPSSCVIYPTDQIALVGPSGSGKSTLMHLLGGLDTPTSGRVEWPALGPREELRPGKITDVFQGPSLLQPLSVIENVRLPLLLEGIDEEDADSRAATALGLFGVADLRDKLPEEISGGQAQRVAIARALVVRPRLVLADEPTGQLDSVTAAQVMDRLLAVLRDIGAAIVVSTHDPRVAARFNTVWTIGNGSLTVAPWGSTVHGATSCVRSHGPERGPSLRSG